ncbi:ankyrin repeat-containing domain protein, partial [Mycena albidolilacea]
SSTVIRQLFSQRQHGTAIAYFYFDFRDEKSQRVKIMLQSIILQLSAQSPKSHSALEREYKSSQGQTLPTYDKLLGILEELLLDVAHTYIVLDALDECNEHDLLVQFIARFRERTTQSLHLLFTSQPRQIFMDSEAFKHASLVTLTTHNMQSDIQRFIGSKLHQLSHLTCRMHPEDITTQVLKKSNGMFRLAALLLIELRDAFNPDLDTILSSFPDSLFGVYSRFLQRIHPTAVFYVSTVLRWLAFSSSPVTMDNLEDALAFDFSNPSEFVYDPTRRGENAARVCKMLEGMIVVNQIWWDNTRAVSFAHASVEDYLRSEKFTQEYTAYDLRAEPSYRFLAQSCLGFLQFISRPLPPAPFSLVRQKYPLGSYAAANWSYHLHRSDDPELLLSLAVRFLQSENGLKRYHPTGVMQLPNVQPLSVCSQFVRFLLQNGADPNMSDNGFAALQAASSHGNLDIVHILLQSGAKVLCAASLHGHLNIFRILLQSGAKVDVVVLEKACTHDRWDQVLLDDLVITASKRGQSDMVRLLLEYGADVNAATKKYNALGAASFHGQVEAIRVLLEKGAEVNATSGIYGSALQIASYQGDIEIVRRLIEHGAKVNAAGGEYGSALQAASREGNTETCRLLLENGAEVNATGGRFGSALQAASIRGHVESVQCLLQYGADINATGGVYGNALQAASANGCVAMVRLLLEKGADVNAFGGSALKAAVRRGRLHSDNWRQAELITLILLENGAHPDITDYDSEEDVDTDDEGAMSDSSSDNGFSSEYWRSE